MAVVSGLDREADYDISDGEESLLSQLVTNLPTPPTGQKPSVEESVAIATRIAVDNGTLNAEGERNVGPSPACGQPNLPGHLPVPKDLPTALPRNDDLSSYPNLSKNVSGLEGADAPNTQDATATEREDTRAPVLRFRSFPRKPFSVTDLTAGTWCELQYFYVLTRLPFGRKTQNAAMKEGSKLHKELEDEVHTTVRVEVTTKEDAFGLRIWNIIQGLKTLRETGLTRELEVWGLVDGNLVNGIIDGLSFDHPDLGSEEQPSELKSPQPSITDFFPAKEIKQPPARKVYLTDVKTRGTMKPANTAQLRPAMVQLFLYHRFLSDMAAEKLNYFRIFRRYNLDADDFFSDTFLAQMANLHGEDFFGDDSDAGSEYFPPQSTSNSPTEPKSLETMVEDSPGFVKYRSLRELVPRLVSEVKQTFPNGADSIANILSVEYRYRRDGSLIDHRTFPMDDQALDQYLGGTLQWWKGEREPRGVQIEDAWKCMLCEFAEDCSWRRGLDQDRLTTVRQRLETKRKKSME